MSTYANAPQNALPNPQVLPQHVPQALPRVGPSALPPAGNRPLHIMIVGEGTYPYHAGGVSTWCHQLVQGMPENTWTAVALTVNGTERSTWDAPPNLARVVNIPLWGPVPSSKNRSRSRKAAASFAGIHHAFLRALIRPKATVVADPWGTTGDFLAALRDMFFFGQTNDLRTALTTDAAVERLVEVWRAAGMEGEGGGLTLEHALLATERLEHLLRPLSHPPVQADVCHLSMNGISALVAMTCKWAHGTPVVMSEHGVYLREQYLSKVREDEPYPVKVIMLRFFRALAGGAYRICDLLTPHSQYNRRWQLKNGADPGRVRTMYNGIDPADFPEAQGEPDDPTIVFVGRIDPLKDVQTLIRAFAGVRARVPNARLRIFGPIPQENAEYHQSCVALVEELGLTGAAVFEGRVPRQVDAYTAGHVVALTSISEGFPYTVVESMSVGRPPVCTNVGGVSEAVGDTGFVVPPRDHEAVAQACIQLLTNAELRHRLGRAARQRVLERFTLDQWNEAYRSIYHELVDRRAQALWAPRALPAPARGIGHDGAPQQVPAPVWRQAPPPAPLLGRHPLAAPPAMTRRPPQGPAPHPGPTPAAGPPSPARPRPAAGPGSAAGPAPALRPARPGPSAPPHRSHAPRTPNPPRPTPPRRPTPPTSTPLHEAAPPHPRPTHPAPPHPTPDAPTPAGEPVATRRPTPWPRSSAPAPLPAPIDRPEPPSDRSAPTQAVELPPLPVLLTATGSADHELTEVVSVPPEADVTHEHVPAAEEQQAAAQPAGAAATPPASSRARE